MADNKDGSCDGHFNMPFHKIPGKCGETNFDFSLLRLPNDQKDKIHIYIKNKQNNRCLSKQLTENKQRAVMGLKKTIYK